MTAPPREEPRRLTFLLLSKIISARRVPLRLVEEGYSEEFGARPLKRIVRKLVEDRLSEEILAGTIEQGSTVIIDEEDGKLTFENE